MSRTEIAIAGAFEHPTRWAPDKTSYQIATEAARGALAEAGLTFGDVDGYACSGVGPIGVLSMCHHLNLQPDWLDSTSIGGSSFVAQVLNAAAAIRDGLCTTVLITYGSTAASDRFAVGTGGGAGSGGARRRGLRVTRRMRSRGFTDRPSSAPMGWSPSGTCISTERRASSSRRSRSRCAGTPA